MNDCKFLGVLVRDPELKYTNNGKAVIEFSLAVRNGKRDDQGKEQADFPRFQAWNKTAENIAQYCCKGCRLFVEARYTQQHWTDNANQKRSRSLFVVNSVEFIDWANDQSNTSQTNYGQQQAGNQGYQQQNTGSQSNTSQTNQVPQMPPFETAGDDLEEIPF